MKKILRKGLKITGITFGVLLILLILVPILFGDQIKQAVKDYINSSVNAEVYFEDVGISIFSNFPNITVTLDKFGVAGIDEFKGDTLVDVNHFGVVVNLFSIFGGEYEVGKITLDEPRIHAKVLKNGKANWDIAKTDSTAVEPEVAETDTTPAAPLNLALKSYSITGGHIIYDDHFGDTYAEIKNLNHKGSGNFANDNYDFDTYTSADEVTVRSGGTTYMRKTKIDADLTLGIDSKNSIYTLKDNRIGVNALDLHFDGFVGLSGNTTNLDLKFNTNQNTFSSILSMVPGMYKEGFDDIDTDGTFTLGGWAKGKLNETSLPGFNVNLAVQNGRFHYPDLPEEVRDINFDLKVDCASGNLDALKINLPKFHALFGQAPIDARCILSGLTTDNMNIDAQAKATLKLEDLGKMFPMEGQEMRGLFTLDGTAKGVYNGEAGTMPTVNAVMRLANGYYKNSEFPSALDKMSMQAEMQSNGDMNATTLDVKQFHTEIDGEPIDATLSVKEFNDPAYNLDMNGKLDLAKLNKIYPVEGTSMAGIVQLALKTSGRVSDIENERYTSLPTEGSMSMKGLKYASADMPQGIAVNDGLITFNPDRMAIEKFSGALGKSPVSLTGGLQNYLAYVMLPDQKIKGSLTLVSSKFDVNEWMVEDPEAAPSAEASAPTEEVPMEVFEVPSDIDFTFDCQINKVFYDNLTLDNMRGKVIMRDSEIRFENLSFGALGGNMRLSGGYNTKDITKPAVDLNVGLANLDVQKTYEAFEIVQSLAPAAKFLNGRVSSSLNLKGTLLGDMTPDISSVTSVGDLNLTEGVLKGFKAFDLVADKIKVNKLKQLTIAATKILYEVKDGRIWVEPFDIPISDGNMRVNGSHGIDQTMDYDLDLDLPAGVAGAAAMKAVSGLLGGGGGATDRLKAVVGLGGTVDNPKIKYVKSEATDEAKEMVEEKIGEAKEMAEEKIEEVKEKVEEKIEEVKEEVDKKVEEAKAKAKAQADKIIKDAEAQAAKIRAEGKKAADKVRGESNSTADQTEKSAKNPFEKAAKKKAADKIRKEGEKKAKKIEDEANAKANKLVADAKKKAADLLK